MHSAIARGGRGVAVWCLHLRGHSHSRRAVAGMCVGVRYAPRLHRLQLPRGTAAAHAPLPQMHMAMRTAMHP